jgi:hypothetical protein
MAITKSQSNAIVQLIDVEIERLEHARLILEGGRLERNIGAAKLLLKAHPDAPKAKRKMSAAGRKAIADAQKKRWALKKAVK